MSQITILSLYSNKKVSHIDNDFKSTTKNLETTFKVNAMAGYFKIVKTCHEMHLYLLDFCKNIVVAFNTLMS